MRVRRVITTRAGGVSKTPYDSFNLGAGVGDDPQAVAANRKRLADGQNDEIDPEQTIFAKPIDATDLN